MDGRGRGSLDAYSENKINHVVHLFRVRAGYEADNLLSKSERAKQKGKQTLILSSSFVDPMKNRLKKLESYKNILRKIVVRLSSVHYNFIPSAAMLKHLASFGVGVYVGIYLDQNRQSLLDEADHFLTGVREESATNRDQMRKMEDDFLKT
ncbi:hypothetical protein DINM_003374 [Dirofilaria immitis]|nr:hypothetical protein [Dirofilaria immitis]